MPCLIHFPLFKSFCSVCSQFCFFPPQELESKWLRNNRSTRKMFVLRQGKTTLPSIQSVPVYLLFLSCSPPQTPTIRDYTSASRMSAPASLVWHTFLSLEIRSIFFLVYKILYNANKDSLYHE